MLNDDITSIKGVGDGVAAKFQKLGIETVQDLIEYVPYRYVDYANITAVKYIKPGAVTVKVTFSNVVARYSRGGLHITEALASDESGSVRVMWFNQPYRAKALKTETEYFVSGEYASSYKHRNITNPACELVSEFPVNTARLVPVYRLTAGLGVSTIRKVMREAIKTITFPETLPKWLITEQKLIPKSDAYQTMHFPEAMSDLNEARRRLGFEEVFELSLASELNKQLHKKEHALEIPYYEKRLQKFVSSLPFALTNDQRRAAWEAIQDLSAGAPMNRLVEGDVGSGKTVVAALVSLVAMDAGFQVAFMAPTELLATQHAESLQKLLGYVGHGDAVTLLKGSLSKGQRETALQAIAEGSAKCVVGTHALFQKDVTFKNLGLMVVDEQHRFGVEQRKKLQAKAKAMPHVLHMTATPIPRSLALTLYGELDISIIAELPPGRQVIKTTATIKENTAKIYEKLTAQLDKGRQAYIVCPQIEEGNSGVSVKKRFEELQKKELKNYNLGLLHGKMKADEKNAIMEQFVTGDIQALVATTVIEVGVDVPNATVMIIESAESFGLAQMHQLRGRVGRGQEQSYCYLITNGNDQLSKRLRYIEQENNGFKLAEYDLELRGPGAIYGTMQHGALDLRVAKLTDIELIKSAKDAAQTFVSKGEKLVKYPLLEARINRLRTITNLN